MKISFIPGSSEIQDTVPCPQPAKIFIPQWYKDIPGFNNISNVKHCMPFLDAISYGYIQHTWADIFVALIDEKPFLHQLGGVEMFKFRNSTDMQISNSYHDTEFIWRRPWSPTLPNGYSALITNPLNRLDLPFTTMSGVVDLDSLAHSAIGNIPFFIKKGFVGVIPSGTPMFQIIPVKRDDWESEKQQFNEEFWIEQDKEKFSISSFYKKKIWHKKSFD